MRMYACPPGPKSSNTVTLLLIACLSCLAGSVVSQSCEDKCRNTFNYYNSFLQSSVLVQFYYQNCLTRCYQTTTATQTYPGSQQTYPGSQQTYPSGQQTYPTGQQTYPGAQQPAQYWQTPTRITTPPPQQWWPTQPPAAQQPTGWQSNPFLKGSTSCGVQRRNQFRVIGGTRADECEYPWVVGIVVNNFWCGGAILDSMHILSAAHCFKEKATYRVYSAQEVTVTVGSSSTYHQTKMAVQRVQVHPNHVPHINDFDVAVLTLQQPLTFSDCVAPLCLPPAGSSPFDADYCVATGWGTTKDTINAPLVQNLRKVVVPLVSQRLCSQVYDPKYINDLKLCAGDMVSGGLDTCRGDSGGPLFCKRQNRFYSYGIVSFGAVCGAASQPGIYTNVVNPQVLDFINTALRQ